MTCSLMFLKIIYYNPSVLSDYQFLYYLYPKFIKYKLILYVAVSISVVFGGKIIMYYKYVTNIKCFMMCAKSEK